MNESDGIKELLIEIRDNQKQALDKQEQQIALAQQHLERARLQIEESLNLQRQSVDKQRQVLRVAFPGILICIVLIIFLVVRYL